MDFDHEMNERQQLYVVTDGFSNQTKSNQNIFVGVLVDLIMIAAIVRMKQIDRLYIFSSSYKPTVSFSQPAQSTPCHYSS